MNKTYEELAKERDEMVGSLVQFKHLSHKPAYKQVQDRLNKKRLEIKEWIKRNPKSR